MSESNQFDNFNKNSDGETQEAVSDTYEVESREDLYRTPDLDLTRENAADEVTGTEAVIVQGPEDLTAETVVCEVVDANAAEEDTRAIYDSVPVDYAGNAVDGMYGGTDRQVQDAGAQQSDNLHGSNPYDGQNMQNNSAYRINPYSGQNTQNNNPYGNSPYNGQSTQNHDPYGNVSYNGQNMQNSNPYGIAPYNGQNAQNNNPYGNNSYNGQNAQSNNPYGNNSYNGQNASNNPYGNGFYNGQNAQNNNPYGNGFYNEQNTQNNYQNVYGNPPYGNGNNPYSPYAVPQRKNNTGLIIGIVIGIIVLFLIAVFALAYKAVDLYTSEKEKKRNTREEYDYGDYDDERDRNHDDNDYYDDDHYDYFDDDYFYDDYPYPYGDEFPYEYDYPYGDDFPYEYDYYDFFGDDEEENVDDGRYYSLHNEIRNDLQYSVKLEDYRYDTTYENVHIEVTYPVIEGSDVPNLDKLNGAIKEEVEFITEYFEEEYQDYMVDNDDYFVATSTGYVTYMDEEKLSIAFSEYIYSDYYNDVFVYCINIDMENGIILDNESLLNTDDAFSVEFRKRSDIQNGEISYLTAMTDQEITKHFKSSDIIVFYIPQGMEIGFNYDAGWVTVTYEDFEKYLKVF